MAGIFKPPIKKCSSTYWCAIEKTISKSKDLKRNNMAATATIKKKSPNLFINKALFAAFNACTLVSQKPINK